jgi:hypothetical protein
MTPDGLTPGWSKAERFGILLRTTGTGPRMRAPDAEARKALAAVVAPLQ